MFIYIFNKSRSSYTKFQNCRLDEWVDALFAKIIYTSVNHKNPNSVQGVNNNTVLCVTC